MSGEIGLEKMTVKDDVGFFNRLFASIKQLVRGVGSQNHKVLRSIIRLFPVDMMDYFRGIKESAQYFFRNETMFINIAAFSAMGMSGGGDANISPRIISASAFPKYAIFSDGLLSSLKGFAKMLFMFGRKFPSLPGCAHFGPGLVRHRTTLHPLIPGRFSHMRKTNFSLGFFGENISPFTAMTGAQFGAHLRAGLTSFLHFLTVPFELIISQFTYVCQLFTSEVSHAR